MKVYIAKDGFSTGGEPKKGEDVDDPYCSREDLDYHYTIKGVHTVRRKEVDYISFTDLEIDLNIGDPVYLVVVMYDSGDTFGRTTGNIDIPEICKTYEEAQDFADKINAGTYGKEDELHSWTGYFDHLVHASVESFIIQ